MKSKQISLLMSTTIGLMAIANPAKASLIGDTINIQGAIGSASNVTVIDPGSEFQGTFANFTETIDVFGDGFSIDFNNPDLFIFTGDIITLSGLDWVNDPLNGVITGVNLVSGDSNVIADISFLDSIGLDSGSITVQFTNNGDAVPNTPFVFSIQAAHPSVPEPSSVLTLLGLGLGALAFKGKKQA